MEEMPKGKTGPDALEVIKHIPLPHPPATCRYPPRLALDNGHAKEGEEMRGDWTALIAGFSDPPAKDGRSEGSVGVTPET